MFWDKYQWWIEYAVWGKVREVLAPSPLLWRALLLLLFSHQVTSDSLGPHGLQAHQAPLSSTISQSLLKIMSIESVMLSNHLLLCRPLLLLPSIFPSIRVFSNQVLHVRWPKCWSYSLSINSSNEYFISSILIIIYNFISSYIEIHQYLLKSHTKKYNRGKI